jgi:protein involved in polysaccharide export with SLBB domain
MNRLLVFLFAISTSALFAQEFASGVARPAVIRDCVVVSGIVSTPRLVEFLPDLSLAGAITAAGGLTEYANINHIYLIREGKAFRCDLRAIRRDPKMDIPLKPWDIVHVPQYDDITSPSSTPSK